MIDLTAMIGNLSQSLLPVQKLISGLAYIVGIILIFKALEELKKIAEMPPSNASQESLLPILLFLFSGGALLYLPTMISVLNNTAFGTENVLDYPSQHPSGVMAAMRIVMETAGVIWVVRGFCLITYENDRRSHHKEKGVVYIVAGVFALNAQATLDVLNFLLNQLMQMIDWALSR